MGYCSHIVHLLSTGGWFVACSCSFENDESSLIHDDASFNDSGRRSSTTSDVTFEERRENRNSFVTHCPYIEVMPSHSTSKPSKDDEIKHAKCVGILQHLPVENYVKEMGCETECIICMVEFCEGDKIRFLPCLHAYHKHCIDDWLMRSFICPSCLEPVDSALLTSFSQTVSYD
ncbi:RING finger protein [Trichinella spiralis]|uniref:RING finger protein n=1 Tax=Trichinella spiralis TaxID=6334 RepID=A0ABR3L0D1_TRISP